MTLSAAPTLPDIEVQPRHAAASANTIGVQFFYHTGIAQDVFSNVRLCGSGDDSGLPGTAWTTTPMQQYTGIDGCPTYTATIEFPDAQVGAEYSWGVIADSGSGHDLWAIPTEVPDPDSAARQRTFTLAPDPSEQHYWLSTSRQLGAQPALDPRRRPTHPTVHRRAAPRGICRVPAPLRSQVPTGGVNTPLGVTADRRAPPAQQ